jgi:serine/threonine protein kinase
MPSDATYSCCDMGLFDFFRRSSSRARSKTTSNDTATTASAVEDASMVSVESDSAVSADAAHANLRHSMPEKPAAAAMPKESLDSTATTASLSSNNDDDAAAGEPEPRESLGSIHNYEIVRELGRGATAVVQLGKQKDGEQLVALKVFKTSLLKKMREVKRVGRKMVVSTALDKVQVEIAIMKKLQHRNLLNLLEVFDDDSETLVLMLEYAPHGQIMQWDAAERVYRVNPQAVDASNASGVFDEPSLRKCVRQLLLGLEYLHNNDICHRDLKPENILLGADGVYKIADFGVAHLFEEGEKKADASNQATEPKASKKGFVSSTAGTYAFMGPETLKGKEYSAYDADVWALGITIYALAFGKIPYYHQDVVELFEMIETQPLELLEDNNSASVSDGLATLLRGMLDKDPDQRWSLQQCKQHAWLHEDLDEAAKNEFLNVQHEQVTVNPEEVARAVTRVTSFNVLMRVQLGANKWKRKAMKSLEVKKRLSVSAPPTIGEDGVEQLSVTSDRSSFQAAAAPSSKAAGAEAAAEATTTPADNQQEL